MRIHKPLMLCLLLASAPLEARTGDVIDLARDEFDGTPLGLKMDWYKGDASIHTVTAPAFSERFVPSKSAVINHGYTSDNYWYRIRFTNPYPQAQTIHLHDPHNVYDEFEVYRESQLVGRFHTDQVLKDRILTIDLPAATTSTIHIRKKAKAVVHQTTFTFWRDYDALRDSIHANEMRYQAVITTLLMSAFLSTTLLFAYRKLIYLYYLGYLLSFVLFSSWVWSVHSLADLMPWGGALSLFCIFFTALFVNDFLELKRHSLRVYKVFLGCAGLSLAFMGFEFVNPMLRAYSGSILSVIIQASTVWLGCSLFFKYRQLHTLIFLVAFGSFLISGFIQILIWMGMIDSSNNYIMFYGVALENILMVLAIGYRILVSESARKHKDLLLLHSYEQLSKVFYPHQILQLRDGRIIEETMPVGEQEACILCFHIVGGSGLMNEGYEDCVEDFMIRCRRLLMEHYDPIEFCCTAYMIREMGDGFLCSVGYPFRHIGQLKTVSAVELAENLIKEFDAFVMALDAAQKIHCSIGIVRGPVKSYFSRSGRIRDDLWGRPIAMASVLAESNHHLFTSLGREPSNIILLHDAVYESLPSSKRENYEVAHGPVPGYSWEGEFLAFRIYDEAASPIAVKEAC